MQRTEAQTIVDGYLDALATHDYDRVRAYLADDGFHWDSPIGRYTSADALAQYLTLIAGVLQRIERRHTFVDGGDVCHWLVLHTQLSERVATPAVQWARVVDRRIRSIELLFDPYRYRLLFQVDDPGLDRPRT